MDDNTIEDEANNKVEIVSMTNRDSNSINFKNDDVKFPMKQSDTSHGKDSNDQVCL